MTFDPQITVPLVAAGIALAAVGVARLAGRAFSTMPAVLAAAAVAVGTTVAALGFTLPRPTEPPGPVASLVPADDPADDPADAPTAAPETTEARITGRLATAEGDPLPATEVVLHTYDRTDEAETTPTVTDADGRYAFDELEVGPTTAHRLTTDHEGATFSTDLLFLAPGDERSVDLTVAPPTSDESGISVAVDSMVLAGDARGIQILHVLEVRNDGDQAFAGGLRLPLHPEASGLTPSRGLDRTRIAPHGGDLVSLAPVLPGDTQIVYSYGVGMGPEGIALDRELRYPTDRVAALASSDLAVDAPGLRRVEDPALPADLGGPRDYQSWQAIDVEAGAELRASVRPDEAFPVWLRNTLVALAAVLAAGIVAFPLVRRRRTAPDSAAEPQPEPVDAGVTPETSDR